MSTTDPAPGAALAFLRELATEVSEGTVDLPCFSNVVVRISEALMDPNTTSEQVVTIVGAEPRLAARLLQTANSAACGALYIMAHVATRSPAPDAQAQRSRMAMLDGWQASIGKAVLESWGFDESLCEAVADQRDYERKWQHDPGLTDVLIASIVIADALDSPAPPVIDTDGVNAFGSIGLNAADCLATLESAKVRIALVNDALK